MGRSVMPPFGREPSKKCGVVEDAVMVERVVAIGGQCREIAGPQAFALDVDKGAKVGLALQFKLIIDVDEVFQPRAVVAPQAFLERRRTVADQVFAFGAEAVKEEVAEPAEIRPLEETRAGNEAGAVVEEVGVEDQLAAVALRVDAVGRAGRVGAVEISG